MRQHFMNEQKFIDAWKLLDINYSKFIRTTKKNHKKIVQKIFKKFYDQGDIYKGHYEGMYCTPCESFWTESQLVDGKCPDCGSWNSFDEEVIDEKAQNAKKNQSRSLRLL